MRTTVSSGSTVESAVGAIVTVAVALLLPNVIVPPVAVPTAAETTGGRFTSLTTNCTFCEEVSLPSVTLKLPL